MASRQRQQTSDANHLAWALRFAQADLAAWRDGDWLNALEDIEHLVTPVAGEARESETALATLHLLPLDRRGHLMRPEPAEVRAWVMPLQKALRDSLGRLLRERREARTTAPFASEEGKAGRRFMLPVRVPFTGEAVLVAEPPFKRLQMFYAPKDSSPQRRFLTGTVLRVADLLTRINLDRLKVCPECKRLFIAVRRQRFDTVQCSLRDRQRRFRQKLAERQAYRRRRTTR